MFIKIPSVNGFKIDLQFLCRGFSEQNLRTHIDTENRFLELGPLTICVADIGYGSRSKFYQSAENLAWNINFEWV